MLREAIKMLAAGVIICGLSNGAYARYLQADPIGATRSFADPVLAMQIREGLIQPSQVFTSVVNNGTLNHPYAYVDGNPVSYVDPLGLMGNGPSSRSPANPLGLPSGGHKGAGSEPGPSIGDALSEPNGNLWGDSKPQDWKCTLGWPLGPIGDNCFPDRCIRHDQCYEDSKCNASSWGSSLLGGTKSCNQCNGGFFD